MAVFTELTSSDVSELLLQFDLGELTELTPISSGIENTNYFLDTTRGRWVLTVFERLSSDELPYYLALCEHLYNKGCRVARPVRTRDDALFGYVRGKPCSIANRLNGKEEREMGVPECRSMGALLAQMHLAAKDFSLHQGNLRGLAWWQHVAPQIRPHVPASIAEAFTAEIQHQERVFASAAYQRLETVACHCDLFRNNTLIDAGGTPEAQVAGVFDFYFAGDAPCLFDLAVTMNDWCIDLQTGRFIPEKAQAFIESYHAVRPLNDTERELWRDMLRAAALRFWMSRLYDFYLPRAASLLTPHDPTHFERVLADRKTCDLPWPV
ncbi:MAG: homoserine kinase [Duodenibacillus sp.]|nr:homoserine kinase [Duodenibacillus sp.]